MTTKAELDKMVKERSIEVRRYWNERAHHFHAPRMQQEYEAGAQFVTGILMPDIERLKEENNVRNIPLFKIEIDIIKKELSEANARIDSLDKENNELLNLMAQINAEDEIKIQSLNDENGRMRKQGWSDVLKLVLTKGAVKYINNDVYCTVDFRDWLESQLHILDEALTQKAEE